MAVAAVALRSSQVGSNPLDDLLRYCANGKIKLDFKPEIVSYFSIKN
jgi:hypothetical protein